MAVNKSSPTGTTDRPSSHTKTTSLTKPESIKLYSTPQMTPRELISALQKCDGGALDDILGVLYTMQQDKKKCSKSSDYRVHKRGARDNSRIENFSTYAGPDTTTRWVLLKNGIQWTKSPLSFWKPPGHAVQCTAGAGELIKFYINAKCDDA